MLPSATSVLPAPAAGNTRSCIRNMLLISYLRVVQREPKKAGLVVDNAAFSGSRYTTRPAGVS